MPDILLAATLHSFLHAFPERSTPPAIFSDSHGREMWDHDIDILRTVGWFTTLFPIAVQPIFDAHHVTSALRFVGALRRSLPHNGFDYFSSVSGNCRSDHEHTRHFPVEIMCQFFGVRHQVSEQEDALSAKVFAESVPLDTASEDFVMLALIAIAADVSEGKLQVALVHSKRIGRQDQITGWMSGLEKSLLMLCAS